MTENRKSALTETQEFLAEMLSEGLPIEPMTYLAYVYGPPECWPEDTEGALPGILKTVSKDDKVGRIIGSA